MVYREIVVVVVVVGVGVVVVVVGVVRKGYIATFYNQSLHRLLIYHFVKHCCCS